MGLIRDTLFAKYLKERSEVFILENEFGFVTYKFADQKCWIYDMYIDTSKQAQGFGRNLIEKLTEKAIAADCALIAANVHLWDKRAAQTLSASFKVGFVPEAAQAGVVTIHLKLKEG